MPVGAGHKSKTVFRKEGNDVAYGTPVACGAGHQIPIIPPIGLSRDIVKEPDNAIRSQAGVGSSSVLSKFARGPIETQMVYRGLEHLLICATGFSHTPETVATGVYKHALELAEILESRTLTVGDGVLFGEGFCVGDLLTRRGTICIDKTVSLWEYMSCMVQNITFRFSAKKTSVEFDLVPYNLDRSSSVNTSSSTWSIPNDDWDPVLFQDMVFWLGDYSTETPLSSSNAIGVSSFELKLQNNLAVKQDSQSGLYIAEPRREKKRVVTGSFNIVRHEDETWFDKLDSQTNLMAMLRFIGPQIGETGHYHYFWLWLPNIKFDSDSAPVEGAGMLKPSHQFSAELPASVPSGFPAAAQKELLIQMQNDLATNLMVL